MKNNTYKNKPKSIDTMDYDKSKYKSWLQQKYAQLLGQEILLKSDTEEYLSLEKEKTNG